LVIIGATPEGKKELVGLIDGVRESAQSWRELLLDLKRRGRRRTDSAAGTRTSWTRCRRASNRKHRAMRSKKAALAMIFKLAEKAGVVSMVPTSCRKSSSV
jgi:Transposase, Mutator family